MIKKKLKEYIEKLINTEISPSKICEVRGMRLLKISQDGKWHSWQLNFEVKEKE